MRTKARQGKGGHEPAVRSRSLLFVALALVAAGCGSTVEESTRRTVATAAQDAGAPVVAVESGSPAPFLPSASDGSPMQRVPGGSAGSGTGSSVTGDGGSLGTGSTGAVSARHDPLKIGVMIFSDANTVLTSVGAATEEPDYKILQSTIIAHINKTGGVAGHPLVPVYYDVKTADSPQDTSEKACTKWTQDDHVFVAIPSAPVEDKGVLRECLGRAGTLALYPNLYSTTRERDFNRWPLWFESEPMSLEAWANTYAVGLARQGFFKGTRVGVIYDEDSDFTAVAESVLLPGLRAQGANVVATYQSSIHSLADLSSGSAEMSNAVLQFQSAHVTNVLFFEKWVGWAAFAAQAEGQRYYPVYGLSSQSGPQTMLETGLVPTTQLPRAKLVSWNQNVDVQPRFGTTWARLGLCREIFRRAKVDITSHGQEGYYGALVVCGGLLALQDAGRVARQPLTPAKLAQALEQLGQNLQTPSVPATRFDGNRHFGAAGWRPASFDESCECFKYTGPVSRF